MGKLKDAHLPEQRQPFSPDLAEGHNVTDEDLERAKTEFSDAREAVLHDFGVYKQRAAVGRNPLTNETPDRFTDDVQAEVTQFGGTAGEGAGY